MNLKKLEESSIKELEDFAKKYPKDIGCLYESYKTLLNQTRWSKDFLDGYLAAISDLIIIKKDHWGEDPIFGKSINSIEEAYQEIGISPEEKVQWLIAFHGGNKNFAKEHATDCLNHCKTDNEPAVVEEFWKKVLILFENEKA